MKNLILVAALILSFAAQATPTAGNSNTPEPKYKATSYTDVDAFCKLIQQGNYEAVKNLIEAGEDINRKSVGKTPLMYAARHNKADIARLLIAHGADLKVKSDRGYTALEFAEMSKAQEAYEVIKEALHAEKAS